MLWGEVGPRTSASIVSIDWTGHHPDQAVSCSTLFLWRDRAPPPPLTRPNCHKLRVGPICCLLPLRVPPAMNFSLGRGFRPGLCPLLFFREPIPDNYDSSGFAICVPLCRVCAETRTHTFRYVRYTVQKRCTLLYCTVGRLWYSIVLGRSEQIRPNIVHVVLLYCIWSQWVQNSTDIPFYVLSEYWNGENPYTSLLSFELAKTFSCKILLPTADESRNLRHGFSQHVDFYGLENLRNSRKMPKK